MLETERTTEAQSVAAGSTKRSGLFSKGVLSEARYALPRSFLKRKPKTDCDQKTTSATTAASASRHPIEPEVYVKENNNRRALFKETYPRRKTPSPRPTTPIHQDTLEEDIDTLHSARVTRF